MLIVAHSKNVNMLHGKRQTSKTTKECTLVKSHLSAAIAICRSQAMGTVKTTKEDTQVTGSTSAQ